MLEEVSFPLTAGCCVQLMPNDGSPGGARCHVHGGWCCMALGFVTELDRRLGVNILIELGFNNFTEFRDVQTPFALQYGVTRTVVTTITSHEPWSEWSVWEDGFQDED